MRRFFKLCVEIEEMVADVYRELASSARVEEDLRDLWTKMALEEEDHARQIRFASRLPHAETIRRSLIQPEKIEHLHMKAHALRNEVKGKALGQRTALRLSLQMEKEFAVVHATCAVEFVDKSMQALFRALATEDERHVETLADYCRNVGIATEGE